MADNKKPSYKKKDRPKRKASRSPVGRRDPKRPKGPRGAIINYLTKDMDWELDEIEDKKEELTELFQKRYKTDDDVKDLVGDAEEPRREKLARVKETLTDKKLGDLVPVADHLVKVAQEEMAPGTHIEAPSVTKDFQKPLAEAGPSVAVKLNDHTHLSLPQRSEDSLPKTKVEPQLRGELSEKEYAEGAFGLKPLMTKQLRNSWGYLTAKERNALLHSLFGNVEEEYLFDFYKEAPAARQHPIPTQGPHGRSYALAAHDATALRQLKADQPELIPTIRDSYNARHLTPFFSPCGTDDGGYRRCVHKYLSKGNAPQHVPPTVEAFEEAMRERGPVSVGIYADDTFDEHTNKEGAWKLGDTPKGEVVPHAVTCHSFGRSCDGEAWAQCRNWYGKGKDDVKISMQTPGFLDNGLEPSVQSTPTLAYHTVRSLGPTPRSRERKIARGGKVRGGDFDLGPYRGHTRLVHAERVRGGDL